MAERRRARPQRAGRNPGKIERAIGIIKAHPSVARIDEVEAEPDSGSVIIRASFCVELPHAWKAKGESPGGVRTTEPVELVFRSSYPLRAPRIFLRPDFNRSLAHVLPGPAIAPPEPCIYDGDPSELLLREGLHGILNQVVVWLENAALGRLIDPKQGWEPVRRDSLADFIVADGDSLRALVKRAEGHAFFRFEYLRCQIGEREVVIGEIREGQVGVSKSNIGKMFEQEFPIGDDARVGTSLAVFVWPGKLPSGKLFIAEKYLPETVTNLGELKRRAAEYGCEHPLQSALSWLESCLSKFSGNNFRPLAIVLCARRPFHLIGSDSDLELCPYITRIKPPRIFQEGDQVPVWPAGHRHSIRAPLLRRLSGVPVDIETPSWVQLGCGSLGSKISLHLARAGMGPAAVIDRGWLSPHNAARHALVPVARGMQIHWTQSKADALASAIQGLGQPVKPYREDVVSLTRDHGRLRKVISRKTSFVVNSTAALPASEALASIAPGVEFPRVIETSLFAGGKVGFLSVEGPDRNPDTGELVTDGYALMREDPGIRKAIFSDEGGVRLSEVGEGCSSATMVMPDARVSMFAASMSETIRQVALSGLPTSGGRIMLGTVAEDDVSLLWKSFSVGVYLPVRLDEPHGWRVRVSPRAHSKITEDVARWPRVETGGIIVGRHSEASRTFHVVDVLPAPEDSERSAGMFVLGTRGARKRVEDYVKSCGFSLYCLGTWHSHLSDSGPSWLDRATADAFGLARLTPSVLLIFTPGGYRGVLAKIGESS